MNRRCPDCKEYKKLAEFDTQLAYCKVCHAAHSREYTRTHKASKERLAGIARWKRTVKGRACNTRKSIKYYARVRGAAGSHTESEWLAVVKRFNSRCAVCSSYTKLTRDHIVPLSKGGSDFISNIQPLCSLCNARKGNRES